jgi:hypothetical protein
LSRLSASVSESLLLCVWQIWDNRTRKYFFFFSSLLFAF